MFARTGGMCPSLLQPYGREFVCVYPYYNRIGHFREYERLWKDRGTVDYLSVLMEQLPLNVMQKVGRNGF